MTQTCGTIYSRRWERCCWLTSPILVEELLRGKGELAPKTIRNLIAVLQSIFSLALEYDLIARTPIRKRHKPALRRKEKTAWNGAQVKAIVNGVPQRHRALFYAIAVTGVRLGELLALRWQGVDLVNNVLHIEHSLWHGQLGSPKTDGSVREILFTERLGEILSEHQRLASFPSPDSFVLCNANGKSLNPDVLRKDVLYPTLDRLGIERPARSSGFHAFRHAAGSFVNAETGNIKLAQELLGHSNYSTTADIYTHTSREDRRDAARAIERAIFGNLFQSVPKSWNKTDSERVN